jgi:hypothetical protein
MVLYKRESSGTYAPTRLPITYAVLGPSPRQPCNPSCFKPRRFVSWPHGVFSAHRGVGIFVLVRIRGHLFEFMISTCCQGLTVSRCDGAGQSRQVVVVVGKRQSRILLIMLAQRLSPEPRLPFVGIRSNVTI